MSGGRSNWRDFVAKHTTLLFFVCLFLVLAAIMRQLLAADPLLDRDDQMLISPLSAINSPAEYFQKLYSFAIFDFQPVRDATFFFNIFVERHTGLSTFHLLNLLIWLTTILVWLKILMLIDTPARLALLIVLPLAIHPSLLTSVFWISARKHLLSSLLLSLTTCLFLRRLAGRLGNGAAIGGIPLLFLLSLLSQPIGLLWPIWAFSHALLRREKFKTEPTLLVSLSLCAVVMAALGLINYLYYTGPYEEFATIKKFPTVPERQSASSLLALGRHFYQFVFPSTLAVEYYQGSIENILGLVLLVAAFAFFTAILPRRELITWSAYYFLPLAIVTVRATNIFVSDTYLLIPSLGLTCLAARSAVAIGGRAKLAGRIWVPIYAAMILALALKAHSWAGAWSSGTEIWKRSYESEPTPNTALVRSWDLLEEKKYDEALGVALRLAAWEPERQGLPLVLGHIVYRHDKLSLEQRLAVLQQSRLGSPWIGYFRAALLARAGQYGAAYESSAPLLKDASVFGDKLEIVAADVSFFCRRAMRGDCAWIESWARSDLGRSFDRKAFDRRLAEDLRRGHPAL